MGPMARLIQFLLTFISAGFRSRVSLQLENAALRHQLALYSVRGRRPAITPADRWLWSVIATLWSDWRRVLFFVQPRTVTGWQRDRFRDHWRRLSRSRGLGRPAISPELRCLIRRMWQANPTRGSPRIVGELRMLGIHIAKSTVEKYRPRTLTPRSPSWQTFLTQHLSEFVAIDFFTVPTVRFTVLFVFLVVAHDRRRILHFNVTEHPTAQWTAQQMVEAFAFDTAPRFLLRDGDGIYGERFQRRVQSLGMEEIVTARGSPWQNPYAERLIGSIRRELLEHVVILNARHLKRLLRSYFDYYQRWRCHRSLGMDAPDYRNVTPARSAEIVEFPCAGGLHHYYLPKAA